MSAMSNYLETEIIKYWFQKRPRCALKRWNGSVWEDAALKRWDGAVWVSA